MSDTFRDAIVAVQAEGFCNLRTTWPEVADDIIAMPEMQAIRSLLLNLVENNAIGYWDFGGTEAARNYLRRRRAPESVIAWVVGDDRP